MERKKEGDGNEGGGASSLTADEFDNTDIHRDQVADAEVPKLRYPQRVHNPPDRYGWKRQC